MARPTKPTALRFSSEFGPPHEFKGAFRPVYCAEHHFSGPWPCQCAPGPQIQALQCTADEITMGGSRGGAKLSPLDSLVLTPKGYVRLGDIKVGQDVSDPTSGGSTKVIGVFPHPEMDIWRLTFDDGASLEVGDEHLWAYREANHQRPRTKRSSQREYASENLAACTLTNRWDRYRVGYTAQIIEEFHQGRGLRFPLTEPVAFTNSWRSAKKIPPYLIGLLLGDGYLRGRKITSSDKETQQYLLSLGFTKYSTPNKTCPDFGATGRLGKSIGEWLKNSNLEGCRSWEKFVPRAIKQQPLEYRLDVLRGLLDSDGTVDKRGHVSFTSTSHVLAKDVQWIVRSIGGKAKILSSKPTYVSNGKKCIGRTAYKVYVWHSRPSNLFLLSRKKARCTDKWNGGHEITRELVKVEYVGKKEARCIKVASPYGLYIADDFIVTHNSEVMLAFMVIGNQAFKRGNLIGPDVSYAVHKNYRGLLLREQASDLGDLLDRAEEMYGALGATITRGSGGQPATAAFPSGARILFGHFGEDAWKKWLGQQYQRIGIDQMEMMPTREIHDRIIGSCRSKWPELKPQVFSTWNPGGGSDLRGAPGQAWIMEYFRIEAYLDGRVPKYAQVRHESGKTTCFIPAKVTDNPFLRYRVERLPDGSTRALKAWKCTTCGKDTVAIERPLNCANYACPTNQQQAA